MKEKTSREALTVQDSSLISEELLSLPAAAKLLPRRRGEKKVHTATLYRWTTVGLRGLVLESIQIGGTRCTSREAMQRFFEKLSRITGLHQSHETANRRSKAVENADRQLDDLGV